MRKLDSTVVGLQFDCMADVLELVPLLFQGFPSATLRRYCEDPSKQQTSKHLLTWSTPAMQFWTVTVIWGEIAYWRPVGSSESNTLLQNELLLCESLDFDPVSLFFSLSFLLPLFLSLYSSSPLFPFPFPLPSLAPFPSSCRGRRGRGSDPPGNGPGKPELKPWSPHLVSPLQPQLLVTLSETSKVASPNVSISKSLLGGNKDVKRDKLMKLMHLLQQHVNS